MDANTPEAIYSHLSAPPLPLWTIALLLTTLLPSAAYLGWWAGRRAFRAKAYDKHPPASFPGDGSLGGLVALLSLIVGFTYGFALNWADRRQVALTEEAAAIGTAFLRADFLPEPGRTELKTALLEYARTRYAPPNTITSKADLDALLEATLAAQRPIWPTTVRAAAGDVPPPITSVVAVSVNAVLDAHTRRATALSRAAPDVIKVITLLAAMGVMFLAGNSAGLRGRPFTWRTLVYCWSLGLVMYAVVDLERSNTGLILINPDAMIATIADMEATLESGTSVDQAP